MIGLTDIIANHDFILTNVDISSASSIGVATSKSSATYMIHPTGYNAFWIYNANDMTKYINSPLWSWWTDKKVGLIREKAAWGMAYTWGDGLITALVNASLIGMSRNNNGRMDTRSYVAHIPANYGCDNTEELGKQRIDRLWRWSAWIRRNIITGFYKRIGNWNNYPL
jgi:hypothetical protein